MKKTLGAAALITISIFCACSSVSKKQTAPPPAPFMPPPPGLKPKKACAYWSAGVHDPRPAIRQLARIRALENCDKVAALATETSATEPIAGPSTTPTPAPLPTVGPLATPTNEEIDAMSAPGALEPWLRESFFRAALAHSIYKGDKTREMKFSFEVANFETKQTEQIRLLTRARDLAQNLGDKNTEDQDSALMIVLAPRLIVDPKPPQYLAVAADFKRARQFHKAREFYRKALAEEDISDLDKLRAYDGIRMSYKLEKNTELFLKETKAYSDFAKEKFFKKDPARYADTRVILARAIWTEGSPAEAEKILTRLEKELKNRTPLYESVFVRSKIQEEAGHLEKSIQIAESIDLAKVSDASYRLKILWSQAWNLRKLKRAKEAAALFEKMLEDEDNPPMIARDRFWLGKTHQSSSDAVEVAKAPQDFAWLVDNDPIGYYGALAYLELKRPLPSLAPNNEVAESSLLPDEQIVFNWLLAAGENDLAHGFLDSISTKHHRTLTDDLQLMKLYARAGSYQSLFGRVKDMSADIRKQILAKQASLLFPQPWLQIVKSAGQRFSVKTELIYSIMRQESSFNTLSRSNADAFGLMQLIPEMAEQAAKGEIDLEISSHEDLYKPEFGIPLGAAYLHDLLGRWHGGFIPTVASYNAGNKAVAGWLKTRDSSDALQFIEDIPYEETRTYVKLVMRNFIFYSRLNSGNLPIDFPSWCLEGLHEINP
jgi:soluble lytic murein transglycosylase